MSFDVPDKFIDFWVHRDKKEDSHLNNMEIIFTKLKVQLYLTELAVMALYAQGHISSIL